MSCGLWNPWGDAVPILLTSPTVLCFFRPYGALFVGRNRLPEIWNGDQCAVVHGGFMSADAGGGPIGGGEDIDGGAAVFDDAADEFMDEMRMGAVVAAGNFKRRRWIQIVVFAGTGERSNLLR